MSNLSGKTALVTGASRGTAAPVPSRSYLDFRIDRSTDLGALERWNP
jgi:hypothetical protein